MNQSDRITTGTEGRRTANATAFSLYKQCILHYLSKLLSFPFNYICCSCVLISIVTEVMWDGSSCCISNLNPWVPLKRCSSLPDVAPKEPRRKCCSCLEWDPALPVQTPSEVMGAASSTALSALQHLAPLSHSCVTLLKWPAREVSSGHFLEAFLAVQQIIGLATQGNNCIN